MKVVYIAQPGNEEPWYTDFTTALGDSFPHVVLDAPRRSLPSSREPASSDQGGHGTREMIEPVPRRVSSSGRPLRPGSTTATSATCSSAAPRLEHAGCLQRVALAEHVSS